MPFVWWRRICHLAVCNKEIAREKGLHVLRYMNNKVSIGIASLSVAEPGERNLQNSFVARMMPYMKLNVPGEVRSWWIPVILMAASLGPFFLPDAS